MLYLPFNMILILANSLKKINFQLLHQSLRQRTRHHILSIASKISILIYLLLHCLHHPHHQFELFRVAIIIICPIVP